MGVIARREGGVPDRQPEHARTLGQRKKPIIRLGMGVKDPERGFPRKTDYLTVRGDQRAVAKFQSVYGDRPKAVRIMVPSSLGLALDISYRSFVGGGDGTDGGRPLALGSNFAPLGYVGGPDVLKVWRQDGSFAEVETAGLDEAGRPLDDIAADLKIEVHTTFTFTIPDVLGWGSFAAVTSKGKKSADNLFFALQEIYSAFGARAPWAFDRKDPPLLVLKPDTALVRFEKDGQAHWGKSQIFVLDIVIPEPFEDMRDRLLNHQRELSAADTLYSGGPREIQASPAALPAENGGAADGAAAADSQAAGGDHLTGGTSPAASHDDVLDDSDAPGPTVIDGDAVEDDPAWRVLADVAAGYRPAGKKWPKEMTLAEIHQQPDGADYIAWAARDPRAGKLLQAAALDYTRVYLPEAYHVATAQTELGS